jgi:hypothetical protein
MPGERRITSTTEHQPPSVDGRHRSTPGVLQRSLSPEAIARRLCAHASPDEPKLSHSADRPDILEAGDRPWVRLAHTALDARTWAVSSHSLPPPQFPHK